MEGQLFLVRTGCPKCPEQTVALIHALDIRGAARVLRDALESNKLQPPCRKLELRPIQPGIGDIVSFI